MAHASGSTIVARPLDAILVGYEDRDNLGIRYLISSLRAAGHSSDIWRYDSDPTGLIKRVLRERPAVVGFSLIFQYMAPDFCRVIAALRQAGVDSHVTMGGHYPSFEPEEVLSRIDGLDSIVRFEGEHTLAELVKKVKAGEDWTGLSGLAYRGEQGVVCNSLRPPVHDLDTLPRPDRTSYNYESEALPTAAVLGSRGCPWACTFCSIRPFYEAQGGSLRRLRSPEEVVAEIAEIYEQRSVRLYLFQDDDFLAGGRKAKAWACSIADLLVETGLAGKVAFKISCRSDEVDRECLARLQRGGLTHVYMGVEAGDEEDLGVMNKRLNPETHLRAGEVMRSLDMSFDFGFMLLQPYSTFQTIRNNIRFLERFVGDGYAVASFCRMLPYAGTPIKMRLESEGRMLGTPFEPDYRFLDPKIDIFYNWILATFHERNFTSGGLCHVLRAMLFEAYVNLNDGESTSAQRDHVRYLAAVCNRTALYALDSALDHIENTPLHELNGHDRYLANLTEHERLQEAALSQEAAELYAATRTPRDVATGASSLAGGFDKTWTQAAAEVEDQVDSARRVGSASEPTVAPQ